jgi:hypothetical protein
LLRRGLRLGSPVLAAALTRTRDAAHWTARDESPPNGSPVFTTARAVRFFAIRPNSIDSVDKIRFSKSVVFCRTASFCRH